MLSQIRDTEDLIQIFAGKKAHFVKNQSFQGPIQTS